MWGAQLEAAFRGLVQESNARGARLDLFLSRRRYRLRPAPPRSGCYIPYRVLLLLEDGHVNACRTNALPHLAVSLLCIYVLRSAYLTLRRRGDRLIESTARARVCAYFRVFSCYISCLDAGGDCCRFARWNHSRPEQELHVVCCYIQMWHDRSRRSFPPVVSETWCQVPYTRNGNMGKASGCSYAAALDGGGDLFVPVLSWRYLVPFGSLIEEGHVPTLSTATHGAKTLSSATAVNS